MTGRHDRTSAGARARASRSVVPADRAESPVSAAPGQHDQGRDDVSQRTADRPGPDQRGVSRAGGGDGLGMTDRADAGGRDQGPASDGPTAPMEAVARRTPTGWRVGDEEVPDLTSAMVLADLLAAELSAEEQAELDAAAPETAPQDAARHNAGLLSGMSDPAQAAGRASPAGSPAEPDRARGPAPRATRRDWPGQPPGPGRSCR